MSRAVARRAVMTTGLVLVLVLALALGCSTLPAQERSAKAVVYTGRLIDERGKPIAGAGFTVGSQQQVRTADALARPVATSDRQGRFRVEVWTVERSPRERPVGFLVARRKHSSMFLYDTGRGVRPPGAIDLGTVMLVDGVTIAGQVRDQGGRPLAGVTVTGKDLSNHLARWAPCVWMRRSTAITDAKGIFKLHCVPANYLQLTFHKPGYFLRRKHPVSKHTPLGVELMRSGFVEGRLVDLAGKGMAGKLWVAYEASVDRVQVAHAGADGRFRIGILHQGQYELSTPHVRGWRRALARSKVLFGPRKDVLLQCAVAMKQPPKRSVRAFDRRTGRPIRDFTVRVFFGWNEKTTAGEMLRGSVGRPLVSSDGKLVVQLPPTPLRSPGGQVLVCARGFAPKAVRMPMHPTDFDGPMNAFLETESAIQGRVVDSTTGKAIAGAQVWTMWLGERKRQNVDAGSDVPALHVRTDKNGRFRIGQLPPGYHALQVWAKGRPMPRSSSIRLLPGRTASGPVIKVEPGFAVQGRLTGDDRGYGALQLQRSVQAGSLLFRPEPEPVPADGSFQLTGLRRGTHELVLVRPGSPRFACFCRFPLAKLAVVGNITRRFHIRDLAPGRLTGKIRIVNQRPILGRLVVLAIPKVEANPRRRGREMFQVTRRIENNTSASTVDLLGRYHLRLVPGTYQLAVLDAGTGLELCRDAKPVQVKADRQVSRNLDVRFQWLEMELEYGAAALGQRAASVRVSRVKDRKNNNAAFEALSLHELKLTRQRSGIPLDAGDRKVRWPVAPGRYRVLLVSNTGLRSDHDPLRGGFRQVQVKPGQNATVRFRLRPPSGWDRAR